MGGADVWGCGGVWWAGRGWGGLGRGGLGRGGVVWAGLVGWGGLGWAGLGLAGLGWAGLEWTRSVLYSTDLQICGLPSLDGIGPIKMKRHVLSTQDDHLISSKTEV